MRRLLATLSIVTACTAESEVSLGEHTLCANGQACRDGATCLAGRCIDDGTLVIGDTCNHEQQCGVGLVCHNFICKPGCTDIYFLDDCTDETWCKPVPGASIETADGPIPVGSCAPSECDPAEGERCADGQACVAVTGSIGACLPYCRYGYAGADYQDSCEDTFRVDYACQPLGINRIPVCLPAGGDEAPLVGQPGCDAIRNACAPGAICVNVVCRKLCAPGQISPCPRGERCTPLGERSDIAYCRAE